MDRRLFEGPAGESMRETESPGGVRLGDEDPAAKRAPVTVLFSDLCGYTSLSEALDPEDLHDIMTQLFGGMARVISKYKGHIEKLLGDAALVLFGVPRAHEDDAARAMRAAIEIHEFVEEQSARLKQRTHGQDLRMHSSIASGIILTSSPEQPGERALGSALNLASRLLQFAGPGEIVCTEEAREQAHGYFEFTDLGPHAVKGREEPVAVYRIEGLREQPITAHRVWGVRAPLIGRRDEMTHLREAVHELQHGASTLLAVRGEAGTGKSRLIEEFRSSPECRDLNWFEASAQPYSQNTAYYLFAEALRRAWDIRDGDPPDLVHQKVNAAAAPFCTAGSDPTPYVGSLFGLEYEELKGVDSESWRAQFTRFMQAMVTRAARENPTVVYAGDLHWADPSSLDLLNSLVKSTQAPVLFLLTYRPPFGFTAEPPPPGMAYEELTLENLSRSEARDMLASLLDTEEAPAPLATYLQAKAEGNPFYLEELVNSLIESGILVPQKRVWSISRDLNESDVPLNVLGVITARLDHLDSAARQTLLAASVVGRTFSSNLLHALTDSCSLDTCLTELQQLDLIRVRSLQPEVEYEFKHAMTQDVAYRSLLKPERRDLHERVGNALESIVADRVTEYYEALAMHFSRGHSVNKAVHYLVKSAEKSFGRYAVEEAYDFYRQAYELLQGIDRTPEEDRMLLEVVNGWAYVIYDRGDMTDLEHLLRAHESLAESLGDAAEHAMFRVSYAIAFHCREKFAEALVQARRGAEIARNIGDVRSAACADVWISYVLSELGDLDEAIDRARVAIPALEHDPIWISEAWSALGFAYWTKGDAAETYRIGEQLLEIAKTGPNVRALAAGEWVIGEALLSDGNFAEAAERFSASIIASPEPWPSYHPRVYLAISYIQMGRYDDALPYLKDVVALSEDHGAELTLTPGIALLGVTEFATGRMAHGMKLLEQAQTKWDEDGAVLRLATLEAILGQLYLNMIEARSGVSVGVVFRNLAFIAKNLPTAAAASETHFLNAIRSWEQIGAEGSCGESYLGLGRLYVATRKQAKARECALKSIECFEHAGIETYLGEARDLLARIS
jgi:class 3 adenylate cyclase/tetratricopeptide (TPR) repeat protein